MKNVKQIAIGMVRKNGLINLSCSELCNAAGIAQGSWVHVMGCTFCEFIDELKKDNIESKLNHKVIKTRTNPALRREHILIAALKLAEKTGVHNLQRQYIANEAGISSSLVSYHFGTMIQLKRTVLRAAIKREIIPIIYHAIKHNDNGVKKLSLKLRTKVMLCK